MPLFICPWAIRRPCSPGSGRGSDPADTCWPSWAPSGGPAPSHFSAPKCSGTTRTPALTCVGCRQRTCFRSGTGSFPKGTRVTRWYWRKQPEGSGEPADPGSVAVGERQCFPAIASEQERAGSRVGSREFSGEAGQVRKDPGSLVGQPLRTYGPDRLGELGTALGGEIGQDRRVEHHQRRGGRGLCCGLGELIHQVSADYTGRVFAGHADSRSEPPGPFALAWPDQAGQPVHIVGGGDIERGEGDPGPPHHLGRPGREGHRPPRLAGQYGTIRVTIDAVSAVGVGVTVGQQAQPRAGSHLQQGERLRQQRQGRQQGGATSGLIGLRTPGQHHGRHLFAAIQHRVAEGAITRQQPGQVADRREQQVRLTLVPRQALQKGQQLRIAGDPGRQFLVQRRTPPGLKGSKPPVILRSALLRVVTDHLSLSGTQTPWPPTAKTAPHPRTSSSSCRRAAPRASVWPRPARPAGISTPACPATPPLPCGTHPPLPACSAWPRSWSKTSPLASASRRSRSSEPPGPSTGPWRPGSEQAPAASPPSRTCRTQPPPCDR